METNRLEHEKANVSPKTHERYEELLLKNVSSVIGDVRLNKVNTYTFDRCWTQLLENGRRDGKGGLAPRTVAHCRRVVFSAMKKALIWELIKKNFVAESGRPKVEKKKVLTYDAGQIAQLFDDMQDRRIFIAALLGGGCGMRRGEIVALKWEDVDFENQTISINKSMEQVRTNIREKETKSTRTRNVAVSSTIIEELRKHRAAQAEEQLRLGIRLTAKSYVYSQIDGRPLKPQSVTHEWTRLLEKTDLPRIRFHDLRHSHATQMLAVGIHPKIASERLGHSSIAITMDMYSHVMPGMQANAAEQVDEAIKRAQKFNN